MCALLGCCVHQEARSPMHKPYTSKQGRSFFLLHNDELKLDQILFKAESTKKKQTQKPKQKQVPDYIIYILSNTTSLLGREPAREQTFIEANKMVNKDIWNDLHKCNNGHIPHTFTPLGMLCTSLVSPHQGAW